MPSLIDPNLKLRWAKSHLDLLSDKISVYTKAHKQVTETKDDTENGWYLIRTEIVCTNPTINSDDLIFDICLIAGDFVANLRACLDHLAWQLALHSGDNPSRDICFPICEKDSLDTQLRIVKSTYGIPEEAIAIMKSLQPYHAGDAYQSTHLWRLNKLWNIDKHRHITSHAMVTETLFTIDGLQGHYVAEFTFRDHRRNEVIVEDFGSGCIMKLPLADKNKVHFNPSAKGKIDIKFAIPGDESELGFSDLSDIYEFIAKKVLPRFAGLFTKEKIPRQ